jgi:hypothetical protein
MQTYEATYNLLFYLSNEYSYSLLMHTLNIRPNNCNQDAILSDKSLMI